MRIDEPIDPERDLVLDRDIPVPPALVWQAWTRPEHLREWFTPRPWTVAECEIEPWPGGRFRTVMRSPDGQLVPNVGCFLEVIPDERLVWTTALGPGFRPAVSVGAFTFTGMILLAPHEGGTRYRAIARHGDAETARRHDGMGFHTGWGVALDQLVAHMARR
jgi:uncharacterized protein YndB with AHSA1/START domain